MIQPEELQQLIDTYLLHYPEDEERTSPLIQALNTEPITELTSRASQAHLAADAVVFDPDQDKVLQIKHLFLKEWLFPGGHVDPEDSSLRSAALRELGEEVGDAVASTAVPVLTYPIDINIHPIPANPAKGEAEHQHFDIRFLFTASVDDVELATDEVGGYRMIRLGDAGHVGERIKRLELN